MGIISWLNGLGQEENVDLKPYTGLYRGFTPSDESGGFFSELEIEVSTCAVRKRWATGLRIEEGHIPAKDFKKLTREELNTFSSENGDVPDDLTVFNVHNLHYLFTDYQYSNYGLVVVGGPGGLLDLPTFLYSPRDVRVGEFEKHMADIEKEFGPNCVPRLKYDGKVQ